MFDVGFFELVLIAVVALLVVGPERLPKLARTAGLWVGRGRRMLSDVKADIEKEMKAEELKRVLEEQKLNNPLHEIVEETQSAVADIKGKAEATLNEPAAGNDDQANKASKP